MEKKLSSFTPRTTLKPLVGDVIFGEEDFILGRKNEDTGFIEVGVTKEQCIKEISVLEKYASKNKLFTVTRQKRVDISDEDESREFVHGLLKKQNTKKV